MEDISTLIAEVKGKGITTTTNDLNKFTLAAEKAEVATKKLGTTQAQVTAGNTTGTATAAAMAGAINALTAAVEKLGTVQVRAAASTRQHNAAMGEAHSLARGLSGSLGALWVTYGNLAGMATGLAIGAALKGVVDVGADVEHTLETIRVLGGATTTEIDKMRVSIETLGKGTSGPKQVAEALSVLTLAGLSASEALEGVGAALNLSVMGGVSIEKASSTLVQVSTALGYTAGAFDHIGDVIAKTAAVSMSSVDSISGAFKSAASVGELYGASLVDIGVGLAAIANLGIQGTAAGTSLKNMYKDLSSGSEKVTASLTAMGLKLSDLKGKDGYFIPLIDMIDKMEMGLRKVTDRQTTMGNMQGERGVKEFAALIKLRNQASKEMDEEGNVYANRLVEINDRITKSYAFTALGAIAMSQTSTNQFKSIGNTLQTTLIKAFADVQPKVGELSRAFKEAFESPAFVNGIKAIAVAAADLAIFLAKNADVIGQLVVALVAFKGLQIAAAFMEVATAARVMTATTVSLAVATKAFVISLGPFALAIAALTAAWYAYKKAKTYALQDTNAISDLEEFTDRLKTEDEKARKSLELRKSGMTAEGVAAAESANEQVAALDKVTKASAANLAALKKGWADKEAELSVQDKKSMERAKKYENAPTIFGIGLGTGNITGKALLAQQQQVIDAEKKHLALLEESKRAQKSLVDTSKERAELEDKAAKDASARITGTTALGGGKSKGGTGKAEALNAEITDIRNAYSEITNEFKIYIENSKSLAATGESDVRTELDNRTKARADYLIKAQESYEKELAAISKYQGKNSQLTSSHQKSMQESAEKFLLKTQQATRLDQTKDENSVALKEAKDQEKLLKAIETTGNAEQKRLNAVLLADQQRLAGIGNMKSERASLEAQRAEEDYNELRDKNNLLEKDLEIGLVNGTVSKLQAERSRASIAQGQAQLVLRKKHIDYLLEEVTAYKKVEAADRTTKNLNSSLEAAKRFQKSLTDAFGAVGTAIGGIGVAFSQMAKDRDTAQRKFQDASKEEITSGQAKKDLDDETFSANIRGYSNMAESAKGFLNQRSAAYKIADGISKALHIAEVARSAASIAVNVAAGAAKMFAQSGWGGFAGVAAMAAVMVGLGFAVSGSGSGGGKSAADVQATQGSGSVFGDSSAKSDSINKSLDLVKENTGVLIPINSAMLESLRAIQASMVGLTNLVVRTTGVTEGTNMGVKTGTVANGENNIISKVASFVPLVGGLVGKLMGGLLGKTTQTIVDSGLQFSGAVKDLQAGQGYSQYASVDTTKKSLFGLKKSTNNRVETQGLSDELSQQFGLVFTNLEDVLKAAAPSLGKSADEVAKAVDNFVLPLSQVSLKGLKGDELTAAINGVISKALDDVAKAAFPGYEKFAKVGEGYSQTLIRVATDVASVQQVFTLLGKTLESTNPAAADIAESLITAAGGLDKLQASTKTFTDAFYTDAEKLAPVQKALSDRMAEYGLSSSTTAEEFKKLVLSQNLTTAAGQSMYLKLLDIAPAFDAVAKATQKLFDTSMKTVDDAMKALSSSVDKEKDLVTKDFEKQKKALTERQTLEDNAAESKHKLALENISERSKAEKAANTAYYDALKAGNAAQINQMKESVSAAQKLVDSLKTSIQVTAGYDMAEAHAKALKTVREAAKSSNAAGYTGVDDAIKELAKPTETLFSSLTDYQISQAEANNALLELQTTGTTQLTEAQKQLDTLNAVKESIEARAEASEAAQQLRAEALEKAENARYEAEKVALDARHQAEQDSLQAKYDVQIEVLNGILTVAQAQIDALTGIDTSVKSLSGALSNFASATAAAQVAAVANGTKPTVQTGAQTQGNFVESLYNNILGRKSEKAGYDFWTNALVAGASPADITSSFLNSDEYKKLHPSFDVGTNDVPEDMLANIHKGERIIPAADNAELMRRMKDEDDTPSVATVALDAKLDVLIETIMRGDVANVQKTNELYRILRDWDGNGVPPERILQDE